MGGVHSTLTGGGNEHLCLSDKPEWGKDGNSEAASIYGVEYKSGEELFDKDNAEKLINHDAVCAVCRSARSVQVRTTISPSVSHSRLSTGFERVIGIQLPQMLSKTKEFT